MIVIPKEIDPLEARVAATPTSVKKLIDLGFDVAVQSGAGEASSFSDSDYQKSGAVIKPDAASLYKGGDLILKVLAPTGKEIKQIKSGTKLISFIWPAQNESLLKALAKKKITALAMDSVPRITRAQSMDVLSSMSNIAGYRAVMEAAHSFGRFFTGQITAAGKMPPAKVLVIGAGVAGLAAVGTAKSLGAIVRAFDTRPVVKEQVESMGGEFIQVEFEEDGSGTGGYAKEMSKEFIDAEMALFREQAKDVDIVITTALIPGKPAPKLWLEDMVQLMKDGSVVVDLAAEQGGNCELTVPGEMVVKEGVTIVGYTNMPSRAPAQASSLYGTNLVHLAKLLCPEKNGEVNIDFDDVIIRTMTVTKDDEITWPPPPVEMPAPPPAKPAEATVVQEEPKDNSKLITGMWIIAGIALYALGQAAPMAFVGHFTVFVLAVIVGFHVIWNVSHALHTPLMSVTNAISGIVVIGALLQISGSGSGVITFLAFIGVLVSTINIAGGFFVTQRMLNMFRK